MARFPVDLTEIASAEDDNAPDIRMAGTNRWTAQPWRHPNACSTWLLTYTTSGRGRYRLGSIQPTPSVGDLVLAHSDAPFEYSVPGPGAWEFHYVSFDMWPEWSPPTPFIPIATGLFHAHVELMHTRQRIEDAFRRLIADVRSRDAAKALADLRRLDPDEQYGADSPRHDLALTAIREILLLVRADALEIAQLDPRIVGALQVITSDLSVHHDIPLLARTAGLSTSRFLHLFREQLGVPPRRAIRTLRLQQAALRLAYGNEPVGTIAKEIGFASIFDLSRGFRHAYGVSPTAYRERFRTLRLPAYRSGRAAMPPQSD